jgi:hypothetical protein
MIWHQLGPALEMPVRTDRVLHLEPAPICRRKEKPRRVRAEPVLWGICSPASLSPGRGAAGNIFAIQPPGIPTLLALALASSAAYRTASAKAARKLAGKAFGRAASS